MYSFITSLRNVKGIGPSVSAALALRNLLTIKDLLLWLPLRYEDRSQRRTIVELKVGEVATLQVKVTGSRNGYRGRRSFQTATVADHTGKLKLLWFNNPHIIQRLGVGSEIFVSGKLGDRGSMVQPTVERVSADTIHTDRLVPIYSAIPELPAGTFRRILKEITDNLAISDLLDNIVQTSLTAAFRQLHFPNTAETAISARERLALEELIVLIERAQKLKQQWQEGPAAQQIKTAANWQELVDQANLPFSLTAAQLRCISEICQDITQPEAMNRLLVGDVGSGKTAVAGIAAVACIQAGYSAALVAPTQILAEQHVASLKKLLPNLPIQLVTGKTKTALPTNQPSLWIGTHAVLFRLNQIKPALLIYDEQHRFGVRQRSIAQQLESNGFRPHVLTLSATPIPRTLVLTIFAHLKLSVIDELPAGRLPITTWLANDAKREGSYDWVWQQLQVSEANRPQVLIVCPFIDPSEQEGFTHIPAASDMFGKISKIFTKMAKARPNEYAPTIGLLHGRQSKDEQAKIIKQMFSHQIDILVTTPIVEVGVDLPAAGIIIIEAAERFGLASLHQMRGRVGRAGQQAYCLLFPATQGADSQTRLKQFCQIHNGSKLAELDLERRGAGDLFGTQQHGFDELQFASWTNVELIHQAQSIEKQLRQAYPDWKSQLFLPSSIESESVLAN